MFVEDDLVWVRKALGAEWRSAVVVSALPTPKDHVAARLLQGPKATLSGASKVMDYFRLSSDCIQFRDTPEQMEAVAASGELWNLKNANLPNGNILPCSHVRTCGVR